MRGEVGVTPWLLAVCQATYLATMSIAITLSGLVGLHLAPAPALATVPFALASVATAAATVPASLIMGRRGRRFGFVIGAATSLVAGALAILSIAWGSFALFCVASLGIGVYQACAQYYRFAAADAVESAAAKGRAVSLVLAGGVAAAFVGPFLGAASRDTLQPLPLAGSYLAVIGLGLVSLLLLGRLQIPRLVAPTTATTPLRVLARRPQFVLAVLNSTVGYAVMSFVMTATPLAIVAHHHTVDDAATVIQGHLLGMFAPSFVTGSLIARFGVARVLFTGQALLVAAVVTGLSGTTLPQFWVALVLLGVGWNFTYIGATTMLATGYSPEERPRVQAASEFLTFGVVALSASSAGGVFATTGWPGVNIAALPLLAIAAAATIWSLSRQRRASVADGSAAD